MGDVISANIAICLVALGVSALIAPLPFGQQVRRYALLSLPIGAIATSFVWDRIVNRLEGVVLAGLYVLYVAIIWIVKKHPPALEETDELEEAQARFTTSSLETQPRVGEELLLVLAGVAAMAINSFTPAVAADAVSFHFTNDLTLLSLLIYSCLMISS